MEPCRKPEVNQRKCCTIGSGVFFLFFFFMCVYLFHVFIKTLQLAHISQGR